MKDKIRQMFCRHKNAIPVGSETRILNGMEKVRVGKWFCTRCGKEWEEVIR